MILRNLLESKELMVLFRHEWAEDGRRDFYQTDHLNFCLFTCFSYKISVPSGNIVCKIIPILDAEGIDIFKKTQELRLNTLDSSIHISASEIKLLLLVLFFSTKEIFPIGIIKSLAKQIMLTFTLFCQLTRGVISNGDVWEIIRFGIERVSSAMSEDLLDIDEFFCFLLGQNWESE